MPAQRKPASKRQRTNTPELGIVPGGRRGDGDVPALPSTANGPRLLKATQQWWKQVWTSPVASSWEAESDRPVVERLAKLHDDRERAVRSYRKQPLVEGSMGQPVLNPLRSVVAECDKEIRQLEDRLGLSPMARLKLGVTFGEMHRSLDSLTSSVVNDDADDAEEDDPRASTG